MKITLRTVLLTLTLLGSYLIGQAQIGKIEQHGWKLVFVKYKAEPEYETGHKEYGEPSVAFFVKDYPHQAEKENPKLLVMQLTELRIVTSFGAGTRSYLYEFDCGRRLARGIRWIDKKEEDKRNLIEKSQWSEALPDTPMDAIFKYACRPRTSSKP
jgi:hypothetical protein